MKLQIPELCLVALIGATASGKSTFARQHFLPTEVISSDTCRAMLADDESDQAVTREAFDLLHTIVAKRLQLGRIAVVDATNVQPGARKALIELAQQYHVFAVAIVFDLPMSVLLERHAGRTNRQFGNHVIRNQRQDLSRSFRGLEREGFRFVHVYRSAEELADLEVTRVPLWNNRRSEKGPFDIVGDVHGCLDELVELLTVLGYVVDRNGETWSLSHPTGRKAVFLGDLVDRGPDSPGVVRLVKAAVAAGTALCVAGNHDVKLVRAFKGRKVQVSHGLEQSLAQYEALTDADRQEAAAFLDGLVGHYVLDEGRLVVAHAGLAEELQGRSSAKTRSFALYGETTGETDEFGLPVRYNWASDYRGAAVVVYGHTPVARAEWLNQTICLDTGCVFGGELTALRYPERELVAVPAQREYYAPIRPLQVPTAGPSAQMVADDILDLQDVAGRRRIRTGLAGTVIVREENAAAALEIMSRFAVNPKWLIYLPPTMSPCATSQEPGLLEHPAEALALYRDQRVTELVCEEKHMGSRAVIVLCRSEAVAERRFGIAGEGRGCVFTRTGRRFFDDAHLHADLLDQLGVAMESAGLWEELATDWVCIDCEIMPWSAKALGLLKGQYAAVGAAAENTLAVADALLAQAAAAGREVAAVRDATAQRHAAVRAYRDSYRRYCWSVDGLAGIRIAPFHLLASEGRVHTDQNHLWHMGTLARLAEALPGLVIATPFLPVTLGNTESEAEAVAWWTAMTERGGEGMVIKPRDFVAQGPKGTVQPAVKCRGPEYLRIIYGPEYRLPANLDRLRARNLMGKQRLALKEFALGIEALQRFVRGEPLRHVHECVFAVLALESEPIDPRL